MQYKKDVCSLGGEQTSFLYVVESEEYSEYSD